MRRRAEKGEIFYHVVISDLGTIQVGWRVEKADTYSDKMFEEGNYFLTEKEAEAKVVEIKNIFRK